MNIDKGINKNVYKHVTKLTDDRQRALLSNFATKV